MNQLKNNVNLFSHVLGNEKEQNKMHTEMMFWGLLNRVLFFCLEVNQNFGKNSILINSGNYEHRKYY